MVCTFHIQFFVGYFVHFMGEIVSSFHSSHVVAVLGLGNVLFIYQSQHGGEVNILTQVIITYSLGDEHTRKLIFSTQR